MSKFYRRIKIDSKGNSAEPVNFVGVHPLRWNKSDRTIQGNTPPDAGFVEVEAYEREFIGWMNWSIDVGKRVDLSDGGKCYYVAETFDDVQYFTLDELHEYWLKEIKGK